MSLGPDKWGPSFWKTLHVACLAQTATPEFIHEFARVLPCQTCSKDFQDLVKQNPFDPKKAFEWSVDIHNKVNQKLGKPVITSDEAFKTLTTESVHTTWWWLLVFLVLIVLWLVVCFQGSRLH